LRYKSFRGGRRRPIGCWWNAAYPPIATRREGRCANLDLGGGWRRDDERSVGVADALIARGLGAEDKVRRARELYVQSWRLHDSVLGEWTATTYHDAEGDRPRRELHYPVSEFEERYGGGRRRYSAPVDGRQQKDRARHRVRDVVG
jgi:hypothetical protein